MSTIKFKDEAALARFLAAFVTSSTAVFNVIPEGDGYLLQFTGGF